VLEQQLKKAKYAFLAAKFGGFDYLLTEVKQRTYRKETFIGLAKNLDEPDPHVKSKIDYSLKLATPTDIEEMLEIGRYEGKEAIFDLVQRKWFFDSGFHNCYVARTIPGSEMCYIQWMISRNDNNAETDIFRSSFPRLGQQDIQFEHAYTFTKHRGNKLMSAIMNQLFQIARKQRATRVITYVLNSNMASIKGCQNAGFKEFETVYRIKLPFATRYRINPMESNQ
jgi:hypothetical protein